MIQFFNDISQWVASEILTKPASGVATIKRFVSMAWQCYSRSNFNGIMEILAGLNMWPVQRLKKIWAAVPSKYISKLKRLESLMENTMNYKSYRAQLYRSKIDLVIGMVPCIPYLGVYLRDLTFMEENADYLNAEKTIINFEKISQIGELILEIRQFQTCFYGPVPRDQDPGATMVAYFKELPLMSMGKLEEESARVQPMSEGLLSTLNEEETGLDDSLRSKRDSDKAERRWEKQEPKNRRGRSVRETMGAGREGDGEDDYSSEDTETTHSSTSSTSLTGFDPNEKDWEKEKKELQNEL